MASGSKLLTDTKKNALLSSFTGFERFLYYNSGSVYSDTFATHSVSPWPKVSSGIPYIIEPSTSSVVLNWYSDLLSASDEYDLNNVNQLQYTLPDHILYDDQNSQYITFLNMIGEHYDIY